LNKECKNREKETGYKLNVFIQKTVAEDWS